MEKIKYSIIFAVGWAASEVRPVPISTVLKEYAQGAVARMVVLPRGFQLGIAVGVGVVSAGFLARVWYGRQLQAPQKKDEVEEKKIQTLERIAQSLIGAMNGTVEQYLAVLSRIDLLYGNIDLIKKVMVGRDEKFFDSVSTLAEQVKRDAVAGQDASCQTDEILVSKQLQDEFVVVDTPQSPVPHESAKQIHALQERIEYLRGCLINVREFANYGHEEVHAEEVGQDREEEKKPEDFDDQSLYQWVLATLSKIQRG